MKDKYDSLTLTFKITDKEKFRDFHQKMFCYKRNDTDALSEEIGGYAVVSSWSNPFDQNEKLEAALEYALGELSFDEREICELISNGKEKEDAIREVENG